MDYLNFVIALSQRSGVKIPEADAPKLRTLRAVLAYLAARQPRATPPSCRPRPARTAFSRARSDRPAASALP